MSSETLKFFEDKSTESIINWMMNHLTEEQIRMCLDQSNIPDSSLVSQSDGGTGPSVPVAPITPVAPVTPVAPTAPKKSASDLFTEKYRKKCYGTQYLIKQVTKQGVEYYEFKEIDENDVLNNPNLKLGDVNWVFKKEPISTFKDYCTEDDKEVLEILKEENMNNFLNPSSEVVEVALDYLRSGLTSPIPVQNLPAEPVVPTPVLEQVQITEPMIKAIKIQQNTSELIKNEYPDLYSRGITMYPIFVYGSEGEKVKHLSVVIRDGKITLEKDLTNQRLLNSKFKKIINSVQSSLISGLYNPSDNIRDEINQAIRTVEPDIPQKIKVIYDPANIAGYTFFGTLSDDELSIIDSEEAIPPTLEEEIDLVDPKESEGFEKLMPQIQGLSVTKKKKPSLMSQTELENWVIDTRGKQYLNEYEPVIYTNALGIRNVKFIKRVTLLKKEDSFEEVKYTPFIAPQGGRDINSGPGSLRMRYDSEDDLLF